MIKRIRSLRREISLIRGYQIHFVLKRPPEEKVPRAPSKKMTKIITMATEERSTDPGIR